MTQKSDPNECGLGPLFSPPIRELVGRTDPPTSREAARKMTNSGAIGKAQQVALAWVKNNPGHTAPELGKMAALRYGADKEDMRQRIGRRLNELEKAGLIRREGVRDGCSIWFPTKESEES